MKLLRKEVELSSCFVGPGKCFDSKGFEPLPSSVGRFPVCVPRSRNRIQPIRIPSSLGLGSVFSSFVPSSSSAIRSNASGGVEIQRLAFLVPLCRVGWKTFISKGRLVSSIERRLGYQSSSSQREVGKDERGRILRSSFSHLASLCVSAFINKPMS